MSRFLFLIGEEEQYIFENVIFFIRGREEISIIGVFHLYKTSREEILRMLLGLQLLECFSFSCKTTAKRAIIGWKKHQPIN